MPHSAKGFLEVYMYEDVIEILLMLKMFVIQTSELKNLLSSTSACFGNLLVLQQLFSHP